MRRRAAAPCRSRQRRPPGRAPSVAPSPLAPAGEGTQLAPARPPVAPHTHARPPRPTHTCALRRVPPRAPGGGGAAAAPAAVGSAASGPRTLSPKSSRQDRERTAAGGYGEGGRPGRPSGGRRGACPAQPTGDAADAMAGPGSLRQHSVTLPGAPSHSFVCRAAPDKRGRWVPQRPPPLPPAGSRRPRSSSCSTSQCDGRATAPAPRPQSKPAPQRAAPSRRQMSCRSRTQTGLQVPGHRRRAQHAWSDVTT